MKNKYIFKFGVSIFEGKKKVDELQFKSEKDLAYYLYKNEKNPQVL